MSPPVCMISEHDFVASIADALQYIAVYHPPSFVRALAESYRAEDSPAARDAIVKKIRQPVRFSAQEQLWTAEIARSATARPSSIHTGPLRKLSSALRNKVGPHPYLWAKLLPGFGEVSALALLNSGGRRHSVSWRLQHEHN